MDNTVDGLMDGMASGARAMKNMFGELMNPTAPTYKMGSPFDFLPSETTRIKYIIHSPAGKPMKTIKIQSPKKLIRIMTVPKAIVQSKYPKPPKTKFPSIEELRKIEKEQERMVEGRTPMKNNKDLLDEIERQKHMGQSEPHEDYEDYQPQKDSSGNDSNESNDVVTGYIPEIGNEWTPVEQQDSSKTSEPFSTVKPYPMSKLHTRIISGESARTAENPVLLEPPTANDDLDDFEDVHQGHTYEVTEETAEESVSVPLLTQNFYTGRGNKAQPTSTTTTTSTTTEEEPNYPAAFLRKYRERTAASTQTSTRFRPSEAMLDTSWIPGTRNTTYKPSGSRARLPKSALTRTKSEKWPPQPTLIPEPFRKQTVLVHHAVAENFRSSKVESSPEPEALSVAPPPVRTPRKNTQQQPTSHHGGESKVRDMRQRGRIRFGDKLNPDEFE